MQNKKNASAKNVETWKQLGNKCNVIIIWSDDWKDKEKK